MDKAYNEIIVQEIGGSTTITIPKRIKDFLNIKKGDKVQIDAETGKYGKYMTMWKKKEE